MPGQRVHPSFETFIEIVHLYTMTEIRLTVLTTSVYFMYTLYISHPIILPMGHCFVIMGTPEARSTLPSRTSVQALLIMLLPF